MFQICNEECLWISASDEKTLKKDLGGSKSSSKEAKQNGTTAFSDDSQSCQQLKKHPTDESPSVTENVCFKLQHLSDWCLHGAYV